MTTLANRRRSGAGRTRQLDEVVARARAAANRFRGIEDQKAVNAIVWALVLAGLDHAVELARLASEETGFGVIDEDAERAIRYVAEPIGVVLAGWTG